MPFPVNPVGQSVLLDPITVLLDPSTNAGINAAIVANDSPMIPDPACEKRSVFRRL
jgi:hypothetical protein